MSGYTEQELLEAKRSIASTLAKCEKAIVKLTADSAEIEIFEGL